MRRELLDAVRDRRTLLMLFITGVAVGPLLLTLLSGLLSELEGQAQQRVVVVSGIEHAPTLRNFIERQSFEIRQAPADYEVQIKTARLSEPVLVVQAQFEQNLAEGELAQVLLVSDSSNQQMGVAVNRVRRLLESFTQERGTLELALRGMPVALLSSIDLQPRDLASARGRAAQFSSMLPYFVVMAVLYGALNAALDATAGERERGSLEPLLANPIAPMALALGKWGAVAAVAMAIAFLSVASFLPAQSLIRGEALKAVFVYEPSDAAVFLGLLAPLAAAMSALIMAIAIRCKSVKEAQASTTVLIFGISWLPMIALFRQGAEQAWFLWVPALAQSTLMNRVLRGESVGWVDTLPPMLICVLVTAVCLADLSFQLRATATRN